MRVLYVKTIVVRHDEFFTGEGLEGEFFLKYNILVCIKTDFNTCIVKIL